MLRLSRCHTSIFEHTEGARIPLSGLLSPSLNHVVISGGFKLGLKKIKSIGELGVSKTKGICQHTPEGGSCLWRPKMLLAGITVLANLWSICELIKTDGGTGAGKEAGGFQLTSGGVYGPIPAPPPGGSSA